MGTAPMGTAPMGAAPGHVAPLLRSHPWRRARGCELWQGRARSAAPRHRDSDNLPAPTGHGWGAPRQQRGGAQHRPRPATTRATSPASTGLCPPPWGCHPAPQCLQHPKTTSCSPARWGTPSASGDTSAGGTQKHIPALGPPGALPRARLPSLLSSCPLSSAQGWKLPPGGTWSRKGAHRQHYRPAAHRGASSGDSPRTGVSHLEPSTAWR